MKSNETQQQKQAGNRRDFLTKTGILVASGLAVTGIVSSCGSEKGGDEDVTTNEDLMREHGILKRILLIYDEASSRLTTGKDLNLALVGQSANLIKTFIEEYHEKLGKTICSRALKKRGN
ncbi:hypothetical protein [Mucilaginibacter sp.]|uniref:hypothetical protein n=1 Tax=Mucilaginibacter sp. TaxID=1882438 RepID=UPI00260495DA|nr:hypothetical protein [Mucilaginibacter sp.]MDB4922064.1 hypothetical protein [Mucilaginibacter sp.]